MIIREALSVDDVLLVPQVSGVRSRADVSVKSSMVFRNRRFNMDVPVFSAPMDTVTGRSLAIALIEAGGIAVLPRFKTVEQICDDVGYICTMVTPAEDKLFLSVGLIQTYGDENYAQRLMDLNVPICVDVAHGGNENVARTVRWLRHHTSQVIMAGNIASPDEAALLLDAGADILRVGIGSGAYCTTRIQTGCGLPTFQSVMDIREKFPKAAIVADGGIKNSGDIVKLLAAGANAVMLGRLLAGTSESAAPYQGNKNYGFKMARGMASAEAKRDSGLEVKHVEGVASRLPVTGTVKELITDLMQGLRSGMSYVDASALEGLWDADFRKVTVNGHRESGPHGVF